MRRVVVTGMGIVCSIGNNTQEVVASLREARSGITAAEDYKRLGFRSQLSTTNAVQQKTVSHIKALMMTEPTYQ